MPFLSLPFHLRHLPLTLACAGFLGFGTLALAFPDWGLFYALFS